MLKKLREYYKEYKPTYWLFTGKEEKPISSSTIQKVFGRAKKKQRLEKMQQYTHYAIALPHIY